jgi:hypothetical protein
MEEFDITPLPHVIKSMLNSGMPPADALGELIDNSFDAKATSVTVDYDAAQKVIVITDDGVGANPEAIVIPGMHDSDGRNTSGRYGIGAKDAITGLGVMAEIVTFRGGVKRWVAVDYQEVLQRGKNVARRESWQADHSLHGTTIRIMGVHKHIHARRVADSIAKVFAPAIRSGRSVVLFGSPLLAPLLPEVEDRREGSGEFNGKGYSWWAGILPSSSIEEGGWRFEFKHRELKQTQNNRAYGCGSKSIARFYGRIALLEPDDAGEEQQWSVDKHKQSAVEIEELCELIYPEIEELLDKADSEHTLEIEAEIAADVSEMLNDAYKHRKKEKRNPSEGGSGIGAKPAFTGRRRIRAAQVQEGNGSITQGGKSGTKEFDIRFIEKDFFGEVVGNRKSSTVYFGKNHRYWQEFKSNLDVVAAWAMAMLAGYAVTCPDDDGQPIMSFMVQDESAAKTFFGTASQLATSVKIREVAQ